MRHSLISYLFCVCMVCVCKIRQPVEGQQTVFKERPIQKLLFHSFLDKCLVFSLKGSSQM
jgi:hypothetical protein